MPGVTFEGSILQDVRKGQQGFATRMSVQRGEEGAGETFPVVGDIVRIQFGVETSEGEVLQDAETTEAVTFEVGASDVMGNPLFKAFDEAVRTLRVGASSTVSASGGEYDPKSPDCEASGRIRAAWWKASPSRSSTESRLWFAPSTKQRLCWMPTIRSRGLRFSSR
jgi:hypothetical protein